MSSTVVMKFGGSSVSTPDRWSAIAGIVERERGTGSRVLIVLSALTGVTDQLHALPEAAVSNNHESLLRALEIQHTALGEGLGVDAQNLLAEEFAELRSLCDRISNGLPAKENTLAEFLATGERLSTRLGEAFLQDRGLKTSWVDVRDLLVSVTTGVTAARATLSAECSADSDARLLAWWHGIDSIVVTQGFTARSPTGDTVVLGRGGSDTAAAYFAGKLGAARLEVWSDVPGMFSADPGLVPDARLLKRLDYREAQEIATTGSKVLHPRCIPALRERAIPIHLKSTRHPDAEGTVIAAGSGSGPAALKAISRKDGVLLISMETVGMWQEVGFLARAFEAVARAGLSVDLVSTSETNVTISLDTAANLIGSTTLDDLLNRLNKFCRATVIDSCSAVSLVGSRIRGLLHRLGPALEAFEEHRIHLVTQAASDLNLTVVVDEDQADRLVTRLHALLIGAGAHKKIFGDSWTEIHDSPTEESAPTSPRWWETRRSELLAICEARGCAYVYDRATVRAQLKKVAAVGAIDRTFYAMKANHNPELLREVRASGAGFECVSPGELKWVRSLFPDLSPHEILFTPNFAPRQDYAEALDFGAWITLDSLYPLRHWPELFRDREILVRIDPGWGSGHNDRVVTGGPGSKFGIPLDEMKQLHALSEANGVRIVGVHTHSGSGILDSEHWARVARVLFDLAPQFPDLRIVNVGGGLGIEEKPGDTALNLDALAKELASVRAIRPELEIWIEPGRFIVAEAGVLLAQVTQVKGKQNLRYIGLTTGMNSLLRPTLYGAYHEIVNLTRLGEPSVGRAQVVGPICESGDRLGLDRSLPETQEGDVFLIATAGAYGHVMSSTYNLREPAEEIVI